MGTPEEEAAARARKAADDAKFVAETNTFFDRTAAAPEVPQTAATRSGAKENSNPSKPATLGSDAGIPSDLNNLTGKGR